MKVTCNCDKSFTVKELPCPDNREDCTHYASFLCPNCGYDNGPDISKYIKNGHESEALTTLGVEK